MAKGILGSPKSALAFAGGIIVFALVGSLAAGSMVPESHSDRQVMTQAEIEEAIGARPNRNRDAARPRPAPRRARSEQPVTWADDRELEQEWQADDGEWAPDGDDWGG